MNGRGKGATKSCSITNITVAFYQLILCRIKVQSLEEAARLLETTAKGSNTHCKYCYYLDRPKAIVEVVYKCSSNRYLSMARCQ